VIFDIVVHLRVKLYLFLISEVSLVFLNKKDMHSDDPNVSLEELEAKKIGKAE
jgi:hypothetical protein